MQTQQARPSTQKHGRPPSSLLHIMLGVAAVAIPIITVLLVYEIGNGSIPSIQAYGLNFLFTSDWDPFPANGGPPILGALPSMYGSVVTTVLSLIFAVPISLGVALFQAELAPKQVRAPSLFLVEMLAAVPSVVYGLWGLFAASSIHEGLRGRAVGFETRISTILHRTN